MAFQRWTPSARMQAVEACRGKQSVGWERQAPFAEFQPERKQAVRDRPSSAYQARLLFAKTNGV